MDLSRGAWKRKEGGGSDGDIGGDTSADDENSIYIEKDTLILLNCKRGATNSIENYRILCPFTKHYNKRYGVRMDESKFTW